MSLASVSELASKFPFAHSTALKFSAYRVPIWSIEPAKVTVALVLWHTSRAISGDSALSVARPIMRKVS